MTKRARTSISELVAKKSSKPDLDKINEIAEKIHSEKKETRAKEKTKPKAVATKKVSSSSRKRKTPQIEGRSKRISLNAPLGLYLDIQRESTLQGVSMMQYILDVVAEDIERNK
jgi:hypothetical protein